ncbi:2,3-bisphosphoglycerate-independent phosphoglycerate mutase [Gossypium australe]|uniref:2,3-bisphosphoglycerate-independent phosphoglycerate mutase n=1 Tax=Gossypium australe TaxID=47621 RepID=A0A5B6W5V5_9ROSI|nr:2,3-bisphosphoglycerate-independent phosphoglycerate mutase [Gossypium australe]
MTEIFQPYLRELIPVFFDDILIYKSREKHLQLIKKVLEHLGAHHLFLKKTKRTFGAKHVTYLGHIIQLVNDVENKRYQTV